MSYQEITKWLSELDTPFIFYFENKLNVFRNALMDFLEAKLNI